MYIRVGIIDGYNIMSNNISNLLECNSNCTVAFCVNNGKDCISALEKKENLIDILFLDNFISGLEELYVINMIRKKYHHIKIFYIITEDNYDNLYSYFNFDMKGYLLKNSKLLKSNFATNNINNGMFYMDCSLANSYFLYLKNNEYEDNIVITKREKQIMICLIDGMTNKEIANKLLISEETVKSHLQRLYKKIKVSDRTQAAIYAIKHYYSNEDMKLLMIK